MLALCRFDERVHIKISSLSIIDEEGFYAYQSVVQSGTSCELHLWTPAKATAVAVAATTALAICLARLSALR